MGVQNVDFPEIDWSRLEAVARASIQRAYSPYSRFSVGAAVLTSDGRVFSGCNVENASFGLTICAERNAVFSAVNQSEEPLRILALYISTEPEGPGAPCGACRQVLSEFGLDALVSFEDSHGRKITTLRELLPDAFELTGYKVSGQSRSS